MQTEYRKGRVKKVPPKSKEQYDNMLPYMTEEERETARRAVEDAEERAAQHSAGAATRGKARVIEAEPTTILSDDESPEDPSQDTESDEWHSADSGSSDTEPPSTSPTIRPSFSQPRRPMVRSSLSTNHVSSASWAPDNTSQPVRLAATSSATPPTTPARTTLSARHSQAAQPPSTRHPPPIAPFNGPGSAWTGPDPWGNPFQSADPERKKHFARLQAQQQSSSNRSHSTQSLSSGRSLVLRRPQPSSSSSTQLERQQHSTPHRHHTPASPPSPNISDHDSSETETFGPLVWSEQTVAHAYLESEYYPIHQRRKIAYRLDGVVGSRPELVAHTAYYIDGLVGDGMMRSQAEFLWYLITGLRANT